jgi:hypothetical protein
MPNWRAAQSALWLIAVTAVGAWAHGELTNRWNESDQVRAVAAKALDRLPKQFGDWTMSEEIPFEDRIVRILDSAGAVARVYQNQVTGQRAAMAMIVGPPGPTSSHQAELCYSSQGFEQVGEGTNDPVQIGNMSNEFRHLIFKKKGVESRQLEVMYAWRQEKAWLVPVLPRTTFGGGRYLFKIQVAVQHNVDSADDKTSVATEFLQALLPQLDQTVFEGLPPA